MRKINRNIIDAMFALLIIIGINMGAVALRKAAKHNKQLYNAMIAWDAFGFIGNGGGGYGYENYWKYQYAQALKHEKRLWVRILFWKRGVLYDASNPPDEYLYPARY